MSRVAAFWFVIAVLAVGTWAMRSLPIMLHGKFPSPRWAKRLLRYVPVAALTALVVPSVLYVRTNAHYDLAPARLVAAAVALAVAWRTKSVVATLACGMIALWAVQAALA